MSELTPDTSGLARLKEYEVFLHLSNARTRDVVTSKELPLLRKGRGELDWNVRDLVDFKMGDGPAILMVTENGSERNRVLLAVSRSYLHRRGGNRNYQSLAAYDWSRVHNVPWESVLALMSPELADELNRELDRSQSEEAPRDLSDVVAAHLQSALKRLSPEIDDLLTVKSRPQSPTASGSEARAVLVDKFATALRMGGADYRNAYPLEPTEAFPDEAKRWGRMLERDMSATDAVLMPGWDMNRVIAGWIEFQGSGNRRIFIKNVDQQPAESQEGGDLIYIRENPDLAVVVQYKRLMRTKSNAAYRFYDDDRLLGQLENLISLDRDPDPTSSEEELSAAKSGQVHEQTPFRLGYEGGFVKFVDSAPVAGDGLSLLPGCYLPARHAQELIAATARPNGGLPPFDPRAGSYLDTHMFASLVSGGWIGAGPLVRRRLADEYLPRVRDEATGAVVLAFDLPQTRSVPDGQKGERGALARLEEVDGGDRLI